MSGFFKKLFGAAIIGGVAYGAYKVVQKKREEAADDNLFDESDFSDDDYYEDDFSEEKEASEE